jgi:Ca2+-binding RTX toxin-like protein
MQKIARKNRSRRQARLTAAVVESVERRAYLSVSFANQVVYPVGESPSDVEVADFNGDGKLDIVTANYGGTVSLLLGNGDGTFQPAQTISDGLGAGGSLADMTLGSFGGNYGTDLAVVDGTDQVAILASNGDGTFQSPQLVTLANNADSIAVGRFTSSRNNGNDDLVVGYSTNSVGVLLGNGDGTFQSPQSFTVGSNAVTSVSIGDVNNDGNADIAVSDKDGSVDLLLGNGDGTFQPAKTVFTSAHPQYGLGVVDLNGDGNADLFFGDNVGNITALLGNGDGTFRAPISFSDPNIDAGFVRDLTGNGMVDRIATNFATDSVEVALGNGDGTFAPPVDFSVGNTPDAIAVGDFNGDGKPDIVVTNLGDVTEAGTSDISVLLNTTPFPSSGTLFHAPTNISTAERPASVASADLTKDGHADLVVADKKSDAVQVFLGNGDGTFQAPRTYTGFNQPVAVAIADVNGDGNPDIVVANKKGDGISVMLGNGDGSFRAPVNYSIGIGTGYYGDNMALAVADLNGDGKPDIVVTAPNYGDIVGLLNNGDGTFKAAKVYNIGGYPTSLAIADINGDGNADILVGGQYSNAIDVLLGNGNGTFQSPTLLDVGDDPSTLTVADVNGDGKPDIVVGVDGDYSQHGRTAGVEVLLGNGDGTFKSPLYEPLPGDRVGTVAVADFNGDGKPDVVVTSGYQNEPTDLINVLLGNGDGTFSQASSYTVANAPGSLIVADLNGDGKPDIVANADRNDELTILLNATQSTPTITMTGNGMVSGTGTSSNDTASVSYSNGMLTLTIDGVSASYSGTSVHGVNINLGGGDDSINLGSGLPPITVAGGKGNDTISSASANDMLKGGAGDDLFLNGGVSGDSITGGAGLNFAQNNPNDSMTGIFQLIDPPKDATTPAEIERPFQSGTATVDNGVLTIEGTADADTISVTLNAKGTNAKVDLNGASLGKFALTELTGIAISGGAGADMLSVDSAITLPATINGGGGDDSITGGGGDNVLVGGGGSDTLVGGGGTNLLIADKLLTYMNGGTGTDSLVGGSGFNIADFAYRTDNMTLSNNGVLTGGEIISSSVQAIWGGTGNDSITGTTAGDFLSGGAGADTIQGGSAGDANDLIVGGRGKDSVIVAAEPVTLYMLDGKADTITGLSSPPVSGDILILDNGLDVI